jgi:cellulose synthase/poly-beta-1,6-N-acetylglucosamine synthase-like glycosyltransferase
MVIISNFFIISYALFTITLLVTWLRFPKQNKLLAETTKTPFVSIIVPVRNEEKNIKNLLQDIENQEFNKNYFELIICNDASTDATVSIIEGFQIETKADIRLLNLEVKENNTSPKKRAITTAINEAKGELIITTDGDCRMGKKWLSSIVDFYQKTDAFLISSPVTFTENTQPNWLQKMWNSIQIIEFGSLVGSAACAMQWQTPNMCSGANLAYKKTAFEEVNGYAGNEEIASGDDEFLMHKIAKLHPEKVQFLKQFDAVVETDGHTSFRSFYSQRKRWASKWKHYTNWQPTALAVYIFLVNTIAITSLLSGNYVLLALKFVPEFMFLASVVIFLKKQKTLFFIPITQLIYPFYVVFFGLVVQGKNEYSWKERKLK